MRSETKTTVKAERLLCLLENNGASGQRSRSGSVSNHQAGDFWVLAMAIMNAYTLKEPNKLITTRAESTLPVTGMSHAIANLQYPIRPALFDNYHHPLTLLRILVLTANFKTSTLPKRTCAFSTIASSARQGTGRNLPNWAPWIASGVAGLGAVATHFIARTLR